MAMAALAILAMAAVMLLFSGNPAQATSATLSPVVNEDGSAPQPLATPTTPRHAAPEPCPGETGNTNTEAAHLVDSGHIALFDVYWNPVEGELTNNPCPPTVEHVAAGEDDDGNTIPAQDNRSPSSINIEKTIIHIPNTAKVELNDDDTPYTPAEYPEVWAADKLENRDSDGDGTPDNAGDGIVWALPACPPDGSNETVALCLSFSAALLNDSDWAGNIEYHLDHVHQIDIDKQDPRYVLGYNVPEDDATVANTPLWDSSDARVATMTVAPGEYDRPIWFFTSRGTYEFQVHIRGNPEQGSTELDGQEPISKDHSVTSDVREYVVHVGAEADLGVKVTVTPENPSPGDNVAIKITASNAGPSEAENTKVEVSLPEGLTYSSHVAATGTYNSTDGVWEIGELAVTDDNNPETDDDSPTLTITATVDANTLGKTLDLKAKISATEAVKITENVDGAEKVATRDLPVLDPNPGNDMVATSTTVAHRVNAAPVFQVIRSVPENSAVGSLIGDAIEVYQNGETDAVTYSILSGAPHFAVTSGSDGNAQLTVAQASLDYETKRTYHAIIGVSDGLNTAGNSDSAVDNQIAVLVNVTDIDERPHRHIPENTTSGTVGAPVPISGQSATTLYVLSGDGNEDFTVAADANGNAQISVASAAALDHEVRPLYDLYIESPDGQTNYTEVFISVTNVPEPTTSGGTPTLTLSAENDELTVGNPAKLKVSVGDLPEGAGFGAFLWQDNWHRDSDNEESDWEALEDNTSPTYTYTNPANRPETVRFRVILGYYQADGSISFVTSNITSVEWQEAASQN